MIFLKKFSVTHTVCCSSVLESFVHFHDAGKMAVEYGKRSRSVMFCPVFFVGNS